VDVPKMRLLRAGREPDEKAFHRLLEWLDEGRDSHGERYLEIRDRLVTYFSRRNCPGPDDLADETLSRVARRLHEQGAIDDIVPARYCYIVAKFVMLESLRLREREAAAATDFQATTTDPPIAIDEARADRERRMDCLEECLGALTAADRQLILDYYRTDTASTKTQRKALADRLGLTANSLAIRAWRLRHRLEACVRTCGERRQSNAGFVS
jgi:hypothetical protein